MKIRVRKRQYIINNCYPKVILPKNVKKRRLNKILVKPRCLFESNLKDEKTREIPTPYNVELTKCQDWLFILETILWLVNQALWPLLTPEYLAPLISSQGDTRRINKQVNVTRPAKIDNYINSFPP